MEAMNNEGAGMSHSMTAGLFDVTTATHVAISSGAWTDPGTWKGGRVPGEDAKVHIPMGITVEYDSVSQAELKVVRVDGALDFATDQDTYMLVETVYTGPMSRLTIGTADNPVSANVTAHMVFADGKIDLAQDPDQIGHGLVPEGRVEIHGAEKSPYAAMDGNALAGSDTLSFSGDTDGWAVGDTLVVMGARLGAFQDETRTITKITQTGNGIEVELDRPLQHDHVTPQGHDLDIFVGNSTRNVQFESENPDGVRGHVMMMHTGDVSIQFAEFIELGRTDKSRLLDDDSNPAGRYALHLHETGTSLDDDMAVIYGNSVHGSPGWGIVQHSSYAAVDYNFVYDIDGAGIVSEDGNEIGQWIGNFVTGVPGAGGDFSIQRDELNADFGHSGVAYENQARQIVQQGNIAANANTGWMYRAAETSVDDPDRDALQFDPAPLKKTINNEEPAIVGFHNNIAIAVDTVLDTGHRQDMATTTDLRSDMIGMVAWEVDRVFDIFSYTGEYVIKDGLFIGADGAGRAIRMPSKHESTSIINSHFENFKVAISDVGLNHDGVYIGLTFDNVQTKVEASYYGDNRLQSASAINLLDQPILRIDASSDLTMGKGDNRIYISGTITDSAGTLDLGSNRWTTTTHSDYDGIDTRTNDMGQPEPEDLLAVHGAMRDGDGWIMPIVIWITDRGTAEHFAYRIDIAVEGYSDEFMQQFEITEFTVPSGEVKVIDSYEMTHSGASTPPTDPGEPPTEEPEEPGEPTPTDGGLALEFNAEGVDIPTVTLDGDFTITAWVELAEGKNINAADAIVGSGEFDLSFENGFLTVSHGGNVIAKSSEKAIDGVWTHYAVVREDGVVRIYSDGALVGESDGTWHDTVTVDMLGDGQKMSRGLTGTLDDVRIWANASDADTVDDVLNGDIPAGAIATYDFEDGKAMGSDTAIVDSAVGAVQPPQQAPSVMELGNVENAQENSGQWIKVNFSQEIPNAVVIMGPVSNNGSHEAFARVRNVTDQGFEYQIEEWDYKDGTHTTEEVSWMALSEGTHMLEDGRTITAAQVQTDSAGMAVTSSGSSRVVLTQVGSDHNAEAVVTRSELQDDGTVSVSLQRQEASSGSFDAETVYVVRIEERADDHFDFAAGVMDGVNHNGETIQFGDMYDDVAFFGAISSLNGGDTVALRMDDLRDGSAHVFLQEEASADAELNHIDESISWFAGDVGVYILI